MLEPESDFVLSINKSDVLLASITVICAAYYYCITVGLYKY